MSDHARNSLRVPSPWPVVLLFVVSTIVWFEWRPRPAPSIQTPAAAESAADPEVRLCDVAVRRFLTATQVVEVTRDADIIQRLNCDVARRAGAYQ
jgi:hypothetical protein